MIESTWTLTGMVQGLGKENIWKFAGMPVPGLVKPHTGACQKVENSG